MSGAIITFVAIVAGVCWVGVLAKKAKGKRIQSNFKEDYNGFHLGEMTKHDVPGLPSQKKFTERKESKYFGQYTRHPKEKKENEHRYEKGNNK